MIRHLGRQGGVTSRRGHHNGGAVEGADGEGSPARCGQDRCRAGQERCAEEGTRPSPGLEAVTSPSRPPTNSNEPRTGARLADGDDDYGRTGRSVGHGHELARQASDRARQAASWLEARQPGDLIEELNRFGRRRPGMFLAGAAIAGVVAGRLTRGIAAASSGEATSARETETPRVPTQSTPTAGLPLPDPGGDATDEGSVIRDPAYGDPLIDPTRGRGVVP